MNLPIVSTVATLAIMAICPHAANGETATLEQEAHGLRQKRGLLSQLFRKHDAQEEDSSGESRGRMRKRFAFFKAKSEEAKTPESYQDWSHESVHAEWKRVSFALEQPRQFSDYQVKIIASALAEELQCPVEMVTGDWGHADAPTNLLIRRQELGESMGVYGRQTRRGNATFNPAGISTIALDADPFGRSELYRVVRHEAKHLSGHTHGSDGIWN